MVKRQFYDIVLQLDLACVSQWLHILVCFQWAPNFQPKFLFYSENKPESLWHWCDSGTCIHSVTTACTGFHFSPWQKNQCAQFSLIWMCDRLLAMFHGLRKLENNSTNDFEKWECQICFFPFSIVFSFCFCDELSIVFRQSTMRTVGWYLIHSSYVM